MVLKFFEIEARFPRSAEEEPRAAVAYLAKQLKLDPELFTGYDWTGRTINFHREQVRAAVGFREFTRARLAKTIPTSRRSWYRCASA